MTNNILEVKDFTVSFNTYAGEVQAVRGVSFEVARNEIIAIVGESASGKSVMTQSIMKLLPSPPAVIKGGSVVSIRPLQHSSAPLRAGIWTSYKPYEGSPADPREDMILKDHSLNLR